MHSEKGMLKVITVDPQVEELISNSLQKTSAGAYPALEASKAEALLQQIRQLSDRAVEVGAQPVILCSQRIRLPLRRFLERFASSVAVLSFNELTPELEIEALGTVINVAG
jgi:flagellar biosynthesis protein FlhA